MARLESQGERKKDQEVECPFVSPTVECASCGSPNFSIDSQGRPARNYVAGICDDCGWRRGKRILRLMRRN